MENIQVALRLRPLNKRETTRNEENIWKISNQKNVAVDIPYLKQLVLAKRLTANTKSSFCFDQCFNPTSDNLQLYETVVKRIALSSLNGINGTIFMYGQTGSGKTYTMMGYNKSEDQKDNDTQVVQNRPKGTQIKNTSLSLVDEKTGQSEHIDYYENHLHYKDSYLITEVSPSTGILVLSLRDIFQAIEKDLDKTYFLRCSYVEIYNDMVFDLLKPADKLSETLTVNEDQKDFFIKGVTEESVSTISEILEKLKKGEANRHYARTTMNHASSRSHTIFRLLVQTVTNSFIREYRREMRACSNINNDDLKQSLSLGEQSRENTERGKGGTMVTESLLNFVDLAGSEKVSNLQDIPEDAAQ